MKLLAPLGLALLGGALAIGCTVSVKTQTKFVASTPTSLIAMNAWTTQAIEIENANGTLTVISDPSATSVKLSAVPFAFADVQADADAAITDVTSTIAIDESMPGQIYAHCAGASGAHGSAGAGTTGCDLTVTIAPGSATQGVPLKVTSHNGPVTVSTVYAAASQQILIIASAGDITATGITGGISATGSAGDVSISAAPTVGANYTLTTQAGAVTLSLPSTFSADHIALTASSGSNINVVGFTDITAISTSRGAAGSGAGTITESSGAGDVTLQSQ